MYDPAQAVILLRTARCEIVCEVFNLEDSVSAASIDAKEAPQQTGDLCILWACFVFADDVNNGLVWAHLEQ